MQTSEAWNLRDRRAFIVVEQPGPQLDGLVAFLAGRPANELEHLLGDDLEDEQGAGKSLGHRGDQCVDLLTLEVWEQPLSGYENGRTLPQIVDPSEIQRGAGMAPQARLLRQNTPA